MSKAKMSDGVTMRLEGDLTHREVTRLWRSSRDWQRHGMPAAIDLTAVDRCDSSALALLLDWKRQALAAGRSLDFHGVPRMLSTLALLSETHELLELDTEDGD